MIDFIKLHVNINPNLLINNSLLNFIQDVNTQTGELKPTYIKNGIKVYKQARHTEYIIKIYNKGKHYKLDQKLLRFEIKYTRMRVLNKKGIKTLFDLYNTDLSVFRDELLNEWQKVLFYDFTLQIPPLSKTKLSNLISYNNVLFWQRILSKDKVEVYKYHLKELKGYVNKYSLNIQKSISVQMSDKINNLFYPPNSHFIYSVKRECKITQIDISFQKDNSTMLSHTGLYYLYENDRRLFDEVKNKYLSKKWINSSLPIQIKEIAHNIRNRVNNRNHKFYAIPKNQISMFI